MASSTTWAFSGNVNGAGRTLLYIPGEKSVLDTVACRKLYACTFVCVQTAFATSEFGGTEWCLLP